MLNVRILYTSLYVEELRDNRRNQLNVKYDAIDTFIGNQLLLKPFSTVGLT